MRRHNAARCVACHTSDCFETSNVDTLSIVQLHNALIISIFDPSQRPVSLTPPPEAPKGPARKRKRLLPYQGPDPEEPVSLKSARLKKWTLGVGKRERERLRSLEPVALSSRYEPRPGMDEIASERGVQLLKERGGKSHFVVPR